MKAFVLDEGALVGGVAKLGFAFKVRTPTSVIINAVSTPIDRSVLSYNYFMTY